MNSVSDFDFGKKKRCHYVTALILAAGRGERMGGDINKQFVPVCGVPVIARTLLAFEEAELVDEIVVAARSEDIVLMDDIIKEYEISKAVRIVKGGATRQESLLLALMAAGGETDYIVTHDGARPLVMPGCIDRVVGAAFETRVAAAAVRVTDTIKLADQSGAVLATVDRTDLWAVQTPQAAEKTLYLEALDRAREEGADYTDDCQLFEKLGLRVQLVEGEYSNIKITTIEDIPAAEGFIVARGENDEDRTRI
jgi:2-C-methyl-D-erythritol 4-phosphate cytidylyltransferase